MKTEAQLNGMTKTQIIEETLKLSAKVEDLSSGPVTADTIKAAYLNLKKEGANILERREAARQAHEQSLAEIEANKEKAIAELKLKFDSSDGKEAKELEKLYKDLEEKSLKAIKDLSFGLEKAENDAAVELSKIEEKTNQAQEKYDALIAELDRKEKERISAYDADEQSRRVSHSRKMEQLEYDNSIALRDENKAFVEKAAKVLNLDLVDRDELAELRDFTKTDEATVQEMIKVAVDEASSKIYAQKGAEISQMKHTYESKVLLLENDKSHLEAITKSQEARIKDLEERLKDVPSQIAEAVKAAQSSVTVNQDSSKK